MYIPNSQFFLVYHTYLYSYSTVLHHINNYIPYAQLFVVETFTFIIHSSSYINSIGGVMISVLASSSSDRSWVRAPNQAKHDCKIDICSFSAKHAAKEKE